MPRPDSLHHTTHYQMSDYRHMRSTMRQHPDALARQVWADAWDDATTPKTADPVRFRRVAIRKRNAWGTGWDHYSTSQTFRYGWGN